MTTSTWTCALCKRECAANEPTYDSLIFGLHCHHCATGLGDFDPMRLNPDAKALDAIRAKDARIRELEAHVALLQDENADMRICLSAIKTALANLHVERAP